MGPTRRSCPSAYARPRDTSAAEEMEAGTELLGRQRGRPRQTGTDTETETEERRPPRGRGRPRREPSTAHEVPLTPVEEAPQMYDSVVHESEETVPHTSEGAGGSTSSSASKPYLRGPAKLPKRPIPVDRRPLIAPEGDRQVTSYVLHLTCSKIAIRANNNYC
jgi:hypothetical protein